MSAKPKATNGKRHVDWALITEDDREYLDVHVTVWNAEARVRTLNAKELTDLIAHGGTNVGFKLVALCLVDDEGRQVFRLEGEPELDITNTEAMTAAVDRVMQKNPKAINELAEALIKLNSITMKTPEAEAQANDVKNDSGETATDGLPIA
jgi:hypothetical protein